MWHYIQNGTAQGPVSPDEMAALINSGQINRDTLLWASGLSGWVPAFQTEFAAHFPPPLPNRSSATGADKSPAIPKSAGPKELGIGTLVFLIAVVLLRGCMYVSHSSSQYSPTDEPHHHHQSSHHV